MRPSGLSPYLCTFEGSCLRHFEEHVVRNTTPVIFLGMCHQKSCTCGFEVLFEKSYRLFTFLMLFEQPQQCHCETSVT